MHDAAHARAANVNMWYSYKKCFADNRLRRGAKCCYPVFAAQVGSQKPTMARCSTINCIEDTTCTFCYRGECFLSVVTLQRDKEFGFNQLKVSS